MSDQTIKINISTDAQTRSVKDMQNELRELRRRMSEVAVGSRDFADMSVKARQLSGDLNEVNRAAGGAAGGTRNLGQSALEVSRGVEDLQYGLNGVLNNIPSLVAALGGGAGLAGVISLAAVAGFQLWKAFSSGSKDATDQVNDFKEAINKASERYEEIFGRLDKKISGDAEKSKEKLGDAFDDIDLNASLDISQVDIETFQKIEANRAATALARLASEREIANAKKSGLDTTLLQEASEREINRLLMERKAIEDQGSLQKQAIELQRLQDKADLSGKDAEAASVRREQIEQRISALKTRDKEIEQERGAQIDDLQNKLSRNIPENSGFQSFNLMYGTAPEVVSLKALQVQLESLISNQDPTGDRANIRGQIDQLKSGALESAIKAENDARKESVDAAEKLNKALADLAENVAKAAIKQGTDNLISGRGFKPEKQSQEGLPPGIERGGDVPLPSGGSGEPENTPETLSLVEQLRQMNADKILTNEELSKVPGIQQQIASLLKDVGTAQNTAGQTIIRELTEIKRTLASQQRQLDNQKGSQGNKR